MENPIAKESHKEIIQKAKQNYKELGRFWSPALNDYVVFNNVGFTHILRKHGVPRPKTEQKRRLALLNDVVEILTDKDVMLIHQEKFSQRSIHRDGKKATELKRAHVWKFVKEKDGKNIKVIVRQFEGGTKHFYSVYAKQQKTAQ